METPNTVEGWLTEQIMAEIKRREGPMPNYQYNSIYSAVLDTLNLNLQKIRLSSTPGPVNAG